MGRNTRSQYVQFQSYGPIAVRERRRQTPAEIYQPASAIDNGVVRHESLLVKRWESQRLSRRNGATKSDFERHPNRLLSFRDAHHFLRVIADDRNRAIRFGCFQVPAHRIAHRENIHPRDVEHRIVRAKVLDRAARACTIHTG